MSIEEIYLKIPLSDEKNYGAYFFTDNTVKFDEQEFMIIYNF